MEAGVAEGWLYAGECALKLGEYKAALYYLGQLAQIKPKLPLAHVQLARTHLMVMDYREALAELEKAMELEPEAQLRQEILKLKEEAGYYRSRIAESSN
jgi:tetratricopeptide (TPR) repeat protein